MRSTKGTHNQRNILQDGSLPIRHGLNNRLVNEIYSFLRKNDGPSFDDKGRAFGHPSGRRLPVGELEEALSRLQAEGICPGIQPYHFANTYGTYNDPRYRTEVIVKKIDQLLKKKYKGDLGRLIAEVDQPTLLSPLVEKVGKFRFIVKVSTAAQFFQGSPLAILRHYLKVKGLDKKYANLKPYHLSKTTHTTYSDPLIVDEVLVKKIKSMLPSSSKRAIAKLCAEITYDLLAAPFTDNVAGHDFKVEMGSVLSHFKYSPFKMMWRFIELQGRAEEFKGLRPYHMYRARPGTFESRKMANEVLKKRLDLILMHDYDCNLDELKADV